MNKSNYQSNVVITDTDDNDLIINHEGYYVTINAGKGDDRINNWSDSVSISGDAGNDSINNQYGEVSIDGGAGNDIITSTGKDVTILGGAGDDSISISDENVLIKYTEGDGLDLIEGLKSDTTLQIGDGSSATCDMNQSGDNVLVAVGDEVITLKGTTLSNVRIRGNKAQGVYIISNTSSRTNQNGTRANDTITNSGSKLTINSNRGQ